MEELARPLDMELDRPPPLPPPLARADAGVNTSVRHMAAVAAARTISWWLRSSRVAPRSAVLTTEDICMYGRCENAGRWRFMKAMDESVSASSIISSSRAGLCVGVALALERRCVSVTQCAKFDVLVASGKWER